MPAPAEQLQVQREALRRGLWRASLASIVVLLVVVALALGVGWKARHSETQAERARVATERAESELWNAKLNEARSRRIAGGPGARVQSAALVRDLVGRPDLDESQMLALRQEAIAQLALVDVEIGTNWIDNDGNSFLWNESFTRYVKSRAVSPIAVYSYPENKVVRELEAHTAARLRRAAFSPCGELLAAAFNNGDVRVWRVEDGEMVLATRGTSASEYLYPFFSPDSRLVGVVASRTNWQKGDALRLYDLSSGQASLTSPLAPTISQFSPDGRHLAVVVTNELSILDIKNGGKISVSLNLPFDRHVRIVWHPRTRWLTISGGRGRILVWDVFSSEAPKSLDGHPNVITDLLFSPDGTMLMSYGWDSMANLWDPISGRRLLAEPRLGVRGLNAQGQVLAHISEGRREGVHTLVPRSGYRTVASTGGPAEPTGGVWMHPRASLVAAAYPNHGIRICGFSDGEEVARLPGDWAQFTPDGASILTFSLREVKQHEIPSKFSGCGDTTEWRERVIYKATGGRLISKGTVTPDGKTLVIGENPNTVLFDLATGRELKRFEAHAQNGSLSRCGQWLVTCKHQEFGSLLDVGTGQQLRSIRPGSLAEFSPDGSSLGVLDGVALRLFRTNTWEQIHEIAMEVGSSTSPAFCFSPDGQMFAVAYNRQEVRLYDAASARELATLLQPEPVTIAGGSGLAFSGDARWLVAARNDGDIVAWELPVIRSELAKLGLDWVVGRASVLASRSPALQGSRGRSPSQLMSAPMAAFLAALFAIAAGAFIFIMQRRMIAGYERVEAVTVAQREKLETAQDALVHSQKMRALGTLAAGIAHDFNNLLSVIRLSNQLAAEETKPTGAAKDNMDAIESAVAQGETIVQSMLGYSRAAAELDEEYSVPAALSETVALLGKKFLSGIVLKFDVAPDLPRVRGARGRLEQIILNLVVNAAEAMNGHGTLRLAGGWVYSSSAPLVLQPRPAKRYIELLVSDSGPGIPEEVLPRIFEPFFTTKSAGATPGTGLGLSTVYTMAEQDGFGLGVETRESRGTTFRILIPLGATSPVIDDESQHKIGPGV